MDPKDLRRPTPIATRVIERRTRARVTRGPTELLPLSLLLEGAAHAGAWVGRTADRWLRRLGLSARVVLGQLPAPEGEPAAAGPVRIRGVVEPIGPVFETPGASGGVVFARTLFITPARPGQPRSISDETRGVDFHVRLGSGERVELAAADVRLRWAPRRVFRPNLAELERRGGEASGAGGWGLGGAPLVREQRLCAGDTVEAHGVLLRQVAPGGEAITGRGTPLIVRLVPPPGQRQVSIWPG